MNTFKVFPSGAVVVCLKTCGRKWEVWSTVQSVTDAATESDQDLAALLQPEEPMGPHLVAVWAYTLWEMAAKAWLPAATAQIREDLSSRFLHPTTERPAPVAQGGPVPVDQ